MIEKFEEVKVSEPEQKSKPVMISSAGTFSMMGFRPVDPQDQMIGRMGQFFKPIENRLEARKHCFARMVTDVENIPFPGVSAIGPRVKTAYFGPINFGKMM